jgi:uncharacterized protein
MIFTLFGEGTDPYLKIIVYCYPGNTTFLEMSLNRRVNNDDLIFILTSEGYSSKAGCQNGIESVKRNSQDDSRYDRKTSSNGKAYFNLKATNGEIIGTSQMYSSESARENGISSVKTNAAEAAVESVA